METLNKNHISYQEMDGLIGLAEKVSENVEELKHNIKIKYIEIIFYLIFVFTGIVLSIAPSIIPLYFFKIDIKTSLMFSKIIIIAFLAISSIQIFIKFQELKKIKFTIYREREVLHKLLNMIEGYKDLYIENGYGNESSVLSKALFEMRLSRINFGVN